jgi:hypothetical protein
MVSCRAARSTVHARSSLEQTQSAATLASVSTSTFLSGLAAAFICSAICLLALLGQTTAYRADGATLEEREGAPASAPESRLRLLAVFDNSRLVCSSTVNSLLIVWARAHHIRSRNIRRIHDVLLAREEHCKLSLKACFEPGNELGASGGVCRSIVEGETSADDEGVVEERGVKSGLKDVHRRLLGNIKVDSVRVDLFGRRVVCCCCGK